jgi:ornithine cyclodeaminase
VQTTGKLTVFGAGIQGKAHIDAIQSCLDFNEIAIVDITNQSHLCEELAQKYKIKVTQQTPDVAIDNADAIVTTTRSRIPIFDGTRVKPGAAVVAVGTSLPIYRELDDSLLERSGKVIVEWKPQCVEEAGEISLGIKSGALNPEKITDLQEIYGGNQIWRQEADQIVIFKSVGIGLSDLAAATEVWLQFSDHK